MLERHSSDCELEAEQDHEDEIETTQEADPQPFSPRDHQEGFWS